MEFFLDHELGFVLSGHKLWNFSKFNSDCTTGQWKHLSGDVRDQKDDITESCSQMMFQLHNIYDSDKVSLVILCFLALLKIVLNTSCSNVLSLFIIIIIFIF